MNMIDEANPLQIPPNLPVIKNVNKNTRGRPRKINSLQYTEQPKSLISQLLSRIRQENVANLPVNIEKYDSKVIESKDLNEPEDDNRSDIITRHDTKELEEIEEVQKEILPKKYYCDFPECEYYTKLSSNLTKHKRRHTSEKPYLCDRCSFRTNFVNSLKTHRRLHTEERPYQCQHCAYRCNSISNLKKHSQNRHKDKL